MQTFSIVDSLKFGWNKIKAHSRLVFSATLILAALQLIMRFATPENPTVASVMIAISSGILQVILGVGFTVMILKLSRGDATSFREIIPPGRLVWQYIATAVLVGLMLLVCIGVPVGIGVLLTGGSGGIFGLMLGGVVGGAIAIWIALRYFFIKIVSIDGVRPIKGILADSAEMSVGTKWQLLLFLLVIALINIVGAITIIGLLLSIPISLFAMTEIYLKLKKQVASTSVTNPPAN